MTQPAAPAPAAAPAAPAAPSATTPAAASPPTVGTPPVGQTPAAPAKQVVLSEAQKRQRAHDNLAKAREAKAAKASGAQPSSTPAAATPPAAPAPAAEPPAAAPVETAAQLAVRLRKAERDLQALKQSGEATKPELELLKELRDADPAKRYAALAKVGVKYEDWTAQLLRDAGVTTEQQPDETPREKELRERLAALEGKHTEAEQAAARSAAEAEQLRRSAYARKLVTDGGDKYALTSALGLHEQLLQEHERIRKDEAVDKPDEHVVAANVEKHVERTLRAQLTALIATAKGKALVTELLGVQPAAAAATDAPPAAAPVPTNGLSSERSGTGVPADFYKWSDRKKREWASARSKRPNAN